MRKLFGVATAVVLVGCGDHLTTRAERSAYAETSHYTDVIAFLDALSGHIDPSIHTERGTLGMTTEGRAIPYLILSRAATSPADAHAHGVPVIYVQANIHAGEVEGKEALMALLRDITARTNPGASVLDSVLLIAVPIYNADGNEKFAPQAVNRTEQNGPEMVGQRPNAQGLDLNRDYVKAEAPETRASLAAFDRWDPDVFVDLHTTDGSFHGYALTYAPSLSPAAFGAGAYTRDSLLPELRRRMQARHGFAVFDYGNFDTLPVRAWKTYDHRPRFGTNYVGLRGRVAILSEAYSHDPFERRVQSTYAFVREILSLVAERRTGVTHLSAPRTDSVPIRSQLTRTPFTAPVIAESLRATGDTSLTQPGVPRGRRRAGHFDTIAMPVYDRFEPTLTVDIPPGYVIPAGDSAAVGLLRLHGITVDGPRNICGTARRFVIDSVTHAPEIFQGHHQARVFGRWTPGAAPVRAPCYLVNTKQRLGALAVYLLEPESDDGLVTWNVFDRDAMHQGAAYPVQRVVEPN